MLALLQGSRNTILLWCMLIIFQGISSFDYGLKERVKNEPTYLILAPNRIRPDQVINIHISIFKLYHKALNVRSSIRREGEEVGKSLEIFHGPGSRVTQIRVPPGATPGNYTLLVEGSLDQYGAQVLFTNETKLIYHPKTVSCYIFTDQYDYIQETNVNFRIIALRPNLLPVKSASVTIYVKDGKELVVRRWLNIQVNHGFYTGLFGTGYPVNFGWWTIEVHGWGYTYKKTFRVENFYPYRHENLITMPAYVFDNEYGISGTVKTQLTQTAVPVRGNATVTLELIAENRTKRPQNITLTYPMVHDTFAFNFPMKQIQEASADPVADMGVYIHANVYDWFSLESKTEKTYTKIFPSQYYIKFLGGTIRTFRPGKALETHLAIFTKAGSPFRAEHTQIVKIQTIVQQVTGITQEEEANYLIGEDSYIHYSYVTNPEDLFIRVRARYQSSSGEVSTELTAYKHYTRSGHYLTLTSSTDSSSVATYIVLTVRSSTFMSTIYYQVMGGNNILISDQLFMSHNQKTFSFATSPDMVPNCRIVVWGILNDGEVLVDTLSIHVSSEILTEMTAGINYGDDRSRDTADAEAGTNVGALAGLFIELKSLIDIGVKFFISEYEVYDDLSTYDDHTNNSLKHTWYGLNEHPFERTDDYFNAQSNAIDANTTFEYAGLQVITDAFVTRIQAADHCNHSKGFLPCWDGSCYTIEARCDGVKQCGDGADELGCPEYGEVSVGPPDVFNNSDRRWTHLFQDRLWTWETKYTDVHIDGLELGVDVPWRPDWWVMTGFSIDKDKGLSLVPFPSFDIFSTARFFLIMLEAPEVVRRGEQIGLQVSVFNLWDQVQEGLVTLLASPDYRYLRMDNYNTYIPYTATGDVQTLVWLNPGEVRQIHFPIWPQIIGEFEVVIEARAFTNGQTISKMITVTYDGITNQYHTPIPLDLTASGSILAPYLKIPIPERFIKPGERRHLYVPGSEEAHLSIVGDIAGPGLFSPHLDVKNVFRQSQGLGEHYLFNLATNFFWLRYLKISNQLDDETLFTTIQGVNIDLQMLYSYIQPNGAMDLFRRVFPSDTWFTSVTLDTLSSCIYREWESHLYIDKQILSKMAGWLITRQNTETGAFWNEAPMYDIKLRGNTTNGVPADISLTAMAVLGLARSSPYLNGSVQARALAAVGLACTYLEQWLDKLADPFEMCLVTYAFHLGNHHLKETAFIKMRAMSRQDAGVYWSEERIEVNPTEFINGMPYQLSRETPPPHQAKAVQATAYALMVYITNNWFADSKPIMTWLQTQRNHKAGFVASQDSLVALQALIMYGEMETNRHLRNILINTEASSSPGWSHRTNLDQSNFMKEDTAEIPEAWGNVLTWIEGTGHILFQMDALVNVEYPDQIRQPQIRAFDLELYSLVFFGRNGSHFSMDICVRWTALHLGPTSGAAVLEIDIPTGYYVRKDILLSQQRVGHIHSQRSDFLYHKVTMYFEYFDHEESCFYFEGQRWYPVSNATIQHAIIVYDAFNPALYNRTLYTTYSLFHLHVCQVCGSFQCPFCPHYNLAESIFLQRGCQHTHMLIACTVLLLGELLSTVFSRGTWNLIL